MVKNAKYLLEIFDRYMNQYVVPIFQRRYGWTAKQIDYFIETLLEDNYPYLSEIKIFPNSDDISVFGTSLIIDGQQRITTYSLTVLAICAYCEKNNLDYNYEEDLFYRVILNKKYKGEEKYRLKLQESDNIAFQKCVMNLEDYLNSNEETEFNPKVNEDEFVVSNIIPNYNHIYSSIDETNIDKLYFSIQKLQIMYSELEPHDNLRRIFFASNNAGLKISLDENVKSILIYGYSKSDNEQIAIYKKYWKPLEDYFYSLKQKSLFKTFLNSFIQYKTKRFSERDAVKYVASLQESPKACKNCLKDIYEYFLCFRRFYESDFKNKELVDIVTFLNPFAHSYLYTLLIIIYEVSKDCSESEMIKCFNLIETHVFRNSLLNTRPSDVIAGVFNLERIYSAYNLPEELYSQIKYSNFYVDDDSFRKGFLEYNTGKDGNKQRRHKYALVRIVKKDSGDESFDFNNTSLEHIRPQNPKTIEDMTIEEYKKVCDTFQNFTLLPIRYNTKLSNKTFLEKRETDKYGYKYSKMEINSRLATFDEFHKSDMVNWGMYLFQKALNIWSFDEDPKQSKLM